jgi:hypothetical protein
MAQNHIVILVTKMALMQSFCLLPFSPASCYSTIAHYEWIISLISPTGVTGFICVRGVTNFGFCLCLSGLSKSIL